jgi:hypothetical protein
MPKYEVVIVYKGQNTYLIEADEQELAEEQATARFKNGDDGGNPCGSDYTDIQNTEVKEVKSSKINEASNFEEISSAQGWDTHTDMELLRRYIREKGLETELSVFAWKIAQEENEEANG